MRTIQLAALCPNPREPSLNLPDAIAELVVFKVGPHAGALDILAALYAPHLQPAAIARQNDKDRDIVDCSGL